MNITRTKFLLILSLLTTTLISCSDYQKALKSSDYNLKYSKAMEYYEKEDYVRAQTLFDEVLSIFKGKEKGEIIAYNYANCYYKQKDYVLGAYYFENFAKTYPYNEKSEKASYNAAYCYYLNSPRPSLDQKDTYKAIESMQQFINKYPNSGLIKEANNIIADLRLKLEEKSFNNAKLYYKVSKYQAARVALKNSIKEFPDSKYREEILYTIVKSSFLLAEKSIESKKGERYQNTISEYYAFLDEFPESDYVKEIEKMYTKSVNQIKNL